MSKYIKIDNDNIIKDCVSYPVNGYITYNGQIPPDILGGWYKLNNGVIVEIPELKTELKKTEFVKVKQEVENLKQINAEDEQPAINAAVSQELIRLRNMIEDIPGSGVIDWVSCATRFSSIPEFVSDNGIIMVYRYSYLGNKTLYRKISLVDGSDCFYTNYDGYFFTELVACKSGTI